ncbi:MAG TPA: hypothetical protein VGV15_17090 [Terriglobales bacterium]|nr:hypothetical protein [Terriglobales bacterium]
MPLWLAPVSGATVVDNFWRAYLAEAAIDLYFILSLIIKRIDIGQLED